MGSWPGDCPLELISFARAARYQGRAQAVCFVPGPALGLRVVFVLSLASSRWPMIWSGGDPFPELSPGLGNHVTQVGLRSV